MELLPHPKVPVDITTSREWPAAKPRVGNFFDEVAFGTAHITVLTRALQFARDGAAGTVNVVDIGAGFGLSTVQIGHLMHRMLRGQEVFLHAVDLWHGRYAAEMLEAAGAARLAELYRSRPVYDTFVVNLWDQ